MSVYLWWRNVLCQDCSHPQAPYQPWAHRPVQFPLLAWSSLSCLIITLPQVESWVYRRDLLLLTGWGDHGGREANNEKRKERKKGEDSIWQCTCWPCESYLPWRLTAFVCEMEASDCYKNDKMTELLYWDNSVSRLRLYPTLSHHGSSFISLCWFLLDSRMMLLALKSDCCGWRDDGISKSSGVYCVYFQHLSFHTYCRPGGL